MNNYYKCYDPSYKKPYLIGFIEKSTKTIRSKNKELKAANKELKKQNEDLKKQKEELSCGHVVNMLANQRLRINQQNDFILRYRQMLPDNNCFEQCFYCHGIWFEGKGPKRC